MSGDSDGLHDEARKAQTEGGPYQEGGKQHVEIHDAGSARDAEVRGEMRATLTRIEHRLATIEEKQDTGQEQDTRREVEAGFYTERQNKMAEQVGIMWKTLFGNGNIGLVNWAKIDRFLTMCALTMIALMILLAILGYFSLSHQIASLSGGG